MKYIITLLIAMLAFCGLACAQEATDAVTSTGDVSGGGSLFVLIGAAVVAVVNLLLYFFGSNKDSWIYKALSWIVLRFGK